MDATELRAQEFGLPTYDDGMRMTSGVAPANMNYYQNGVCQPVPMAQMPLMTPTPPAIMQVPLRDAQMMLYPSQQHVQQFGQGSYLMPLGYVQQPMFVYSQPQQRAIAYGSPPPSEGVVSPEQFHVGSPPAQAPPPPPKAHGGNRETTNTGTGRGRGGGRNRGGGHGNKGTNQQGRQQQQLQEPPTPSYYPGSYGYELGMYCTPPQEMRINEIGFPAVLQTPSGHLYVYNQNNRALAPTPPPQPEIVADTPDADPDPGSMEQRQISSDVVPQRHLDDAPWPLETQTNLVSNLNSIIS